MDTTFVQRGNGVGGQFPPAIHLPALILRAFILRSEVVSYFFLAGADTADTAL